MFREDENKPNDEGIICPHCKNDKWYEGPEGGGSVNLKCTRCGSKYNYMGPFGLQELEIHDDHKDILREEKLKKILD